MSKSVMDKVTDRFKVKVYKKREDSRTSLCGEKFVSEKDPAFDGDKKGGYFIIPAHHADFINQTYRHYVLSAPFIPGVDDAKNLAEQAKPETEEVKMKKGSFGRMVPVE